MKPSLKQLTDRVWVYPFEAERDRPNLGYVRGDRLSLSVDAGHSDAHIDEFYRSLEAEGLTPPDLTILTHWHWDHTFAMHKVHGLTLANRRTDRHLRNFRDRIGREGIEAFVKIRYHHPAAPATVERTGGDRVLVRFAEAVKAPAPGQAAVFYDSEQRVIGGGIISKEER